MNGTILNLKPQTHGLYRSVFVQEFLPGFLSCIFERLGLLEHGASDDERKGIEYIWSEWLGFPSDCT